MKFQHAVIQIEASQGKKYYVLVPGQANSFDELHVDFQCAEEVDGRRRYTLFLHPKEDLLVLDLAVEFACPTLAKFFANGYQSWSESRSLAPGNEIPRLRGLARPLMGFSGDEHIPGIPRGKGVLHSWTYTQLELTSGDSVYLGSLNEHTGFTLFIHKQSENTLTVRKDISGLRLAHSFPALDFVVGQGGVAPYFEALKPPPANPERPVGWTSWYRYFTNISEEIILENAKAVAESGLPFQYVQVDDGWQQAVGDWRSANRRFPGGMGTVASEIRALGLMPGLWLAPFVASKQSELVRRNPDWLLKNERGKSLRAGWNPYWGGWFYALDFYNPAVQDYLSGVFHVVLDKWGYDLLKLDFLFAVCLRPPEGKTRGQVMHEAMEFLRRQLGDRKMLACGVPLSAAFGHADYCRVGPDLHLAWEHRLLAWLRHRERVSTLAALRTNLERWQLHGHMFISDPDVFVLRQDRQRLTRVQQNTVLTVNALLGGVLFTSDDVGAYSPEQRSELEDAFVLTGCLVRAVVQLKPDLYSIGFEKAGDLYCAYCNLNNNPETIEATKNGRVSLRPFETIILKELGV